MSGGLDNVIVWDVAAREHKQTFEEMRIRSPISLSPDGKTLASEDYKGIHLWDVDTGEFKKILQPPKSFKFEKD